MYIKIVNIVIILISLSSLKRKICAVIGQTIEYKCLLLWVSDLVVIICAAYVPLLLLGWCVWNFIVLFFSFFFLFILEFNGLKKPLRTRDLLVTYFRNWDALWDFQLYINVCRVLARIRKTKDLVLPTQAKNPVELLSRDSKKPELGILWGV